MKNYTLAVNRRYKRDGEQEADFISCITFGKSAEFAQKYLHKGMRILCSDTDDDIARYSVMHGNEQLFASKYKLYLPTEEELKAEIETQKAMFYLQQKESEEQELE